MAQYKIKKYRFYKPGEEIELEKVTTAERVGDALLKIWIIASAALLLFNLIRFTF